MPEFEVLFKVNDSPGPLTKNWKDGQPIAIKSKGAEFTAAEVDTWIGVLGTGTLGPNPAQFNALEKEKKKQLRRRMRQLNLYLDPPAISKDPTTVEALRQRRWGNAPGDPDLLAEQTADIERRIDDAVATKASIDAEDLLDVNWGVPRPGEPWRRGRRHDGRTGGRRHARPDGRNAGSARAAQGLGAPKRPCALREHLRGGPRE